MNKVLTRRKIFTLLIPILLITALLIMWAFQFAKTNSRKYVQKEELYETGETVELGENFFVDAKESLDGYSIRVNSAKLVNYKEYYESSGTPFNSDNFTTGYPIPKYTCLLNITIRNEDNTEGALMVQKFALYNKALQVPVDFELWGMFDEHFDGYPFIKLVENSEADMTIPFTPMQLNSGTDSSKLEKMMENDEFNFCISEFPVRKMIKTRLRE